MVKFRCKTALQVKLSVLTNMKSHLRITQLIEANKDIYDSADRAIFEEFKLSLNTGQARAAERDDSGVWRVNEWVKQAILLGFRMGAIIDQSPTDHSLSFLDKDTYRVQQFTVTKNVRVVPGGSAIRDGAYIAPGVVCMPPMYVNVGAYVDSGTMIDSHALVGSCAQIGGVLEPIGAMPRYY